jgi:hypothetical protein
MKEYSAARRLDADFLFDLVTLVEQLTKLEQKD